MGQSNSTFGQTFFIPKPAFTENELPDQTGRVCIITGGYTGIGLELARIIYQKNGTVYLAGRSSSKGDTAIQKLRNEVPSSQGKLEILQLDLADLTAIKPAVQQFLSKEKRLDVLVNNAGLMWPPKDMKSAQGIEIQTATNIYGPFLLTTLLHPLMAETAKFRSEQGAVRILWAASIAVDVASPPGSVMFEQKDGVEMVSESMNISNSWYGQSKSANVMLGVECARRWGSEGIISNFFNPGNLRTELVRHTSWIIVQWLKLVTYPSVFGAYTELFAGWSPDITADKNGCYVIPWGRVGTYNAGLHNAIKDVEQGGEGKAEKLWEVCERVCGPYM